MRRPRSLFLLILGSIAIIVSDASGQPFLSGIDVSRWQGTVNWNSVKASGVDFAFTKATEGVNYVDPQYHNNMQGATAAGVMIGPYHFCRIDSFNGVPFTSYDGSPFVPGSDPYVDAVNEANDFLDAIVPYYESGSYLPPVADVEGLPDFGNLSLERTFISNWMQIFSDTIDSTLGKRPVVYTSLSGANSRYTANFAAQHELWLAWWKSSGLTNPPVASDTPLFGDWQFWQWTNQWSVPGVTGNVDGNVFGGTTEDLRALQITLDTNPGTKFQNVRTLADFEVGEGVFQWSTSFSGSNSGILNGSDATRITSHAHEGDAAQQISIVGDPNGWFLRHVSGNASPAASPSSNVPFESTGYVGLWLMTETPGVTVSIALDDLSPSVDRGILKDVIADGQWHLYEWNLDDNDEWIGWTSGANGTIEGQTVTLDSIQFAGSGNAVIFVDSVSHNPDGSLLPSPGDFDYDGDVDAEDLEAWQTNFGKATAASMDDGDADGDGDVDGRDLLLWQKNFQPQPFAEATAIPEVSSAALLVGLMASLLAKRPVTTAA